MSKIIQPLHRENQFYLKELTIIIGLKFTTITVSTLTMTTLQH